MADRQSSGNSMIYEGRIRPTGFRTGLLAEREQDWNAFQADAAWHNVRDDSEKKGPPIANINSSIPRPTTFFAIR
jgi:hypothetical protein